MFPTLYGALTAGGATAWTPAQPTTDGGVSPHTWLVPGVANFQDAAKTTPAGAGDPVGAIVNQGSDTYDVVQATAGNRPVLSAGGVWQFDGTDYWRGPFGGGLINQPLTIFFVAQLAAEGGDTNIILDGDDATNRIIINETSDNRWRVFAGLSLFAGPSDANNRVWIVFAYGNSSAVWRGGGAPVIIGPAGTAGLDGLTVGATQINTLPWVGHISEPLIYTGELSNDDKDLVAGYLADKYGLSWSSVIGTPAPGTDLSDDFDDNSLDAAQWSTQITDSGTSPAINETGQQLKYTITSSAANGGLKCHTEGKFALAGDFDVQVDMEIVTSGGNWLAGLILATHAALDATRPGEEVRAVADETIIGGEIRTGGLPTVLDGTGSYIARPGASLKLRVTRVGFVATCLYWDGDSWEVLETGAIGTANMIISLWLRCDTVGEAFDIRFDNLIVNSGTVVVN